jgi:glycosyltransferase involved in cell wall biosynthesis
MILISVVIPCYNCSKTILRAVNSVSEQSLKPLEIILVDDYSYDNTLTILNNICDIYKKICDIKIISLQANKGVSNARNAGWNLARGDYIAFLDADDSWHPQKLELQCFALTCNKHVFGCGTKHIISKDTINTYYCNTPRVSIVGFKELLWRNYFITSSVIIRNQKEFRFNINRRYMEDHLLWLEVAEAGYTWILIEIPLSSHHKPDFGSSGLSGDLLKMEYSELANYCLLYQKHSFSFIKLVILLIWSILKFFRRVIIVFLRRI